MPKKCQRNEQSTRHVLRRYLSARLQCGMRCCTLPSILIAESKASSIFLAGNSGRNKLRKVTGSIISKVLDNYVGKDDFRFPLWIRYDNERFGKRSSASCLGGQPEQVSGCSVTVLLVVSHTELSGVELKSPKRHIPFLLVFCLEFNRGMGYLRIGCSRSCTSLFSPELHLM